MGRFVQSEYSVRFLEVFDLLVEKHIIENMKEFCRRMDYLPQSMSQVRNGKRDVTLDLIIKFYHEFGGNPVYVLLGLGNKLLDKNEIPVIPAKPIGLAGDNYKLVHMLEELVESKNEYIALLKKEVDRLNSEAESRRK